MLELGKVFVISSSGFIGQKLCRRLFEFGVVVDVLVSILLRIVASASAAAGTIVGNRSN